MFGSEEHQGHSTQELQRLSMQLAIQLPAGMTEALKVVGYLRDLVKWQQGIPYSWHDDIGPTGSGDVVPFSKRA